MPSKTVKKIEKRNKDFKKLSAAQKRVAIAQDALAQIKAKKFVPESGICIRLNKPITANGDDSVKVVLGGVKCHVCAVGAMFLSSIRNGNGLKMGDISMMGENERLDEVGFWSIEDHMHNFFSPAQLELIENAFEQGEGYYSSACRIDDKSAASWGGAFERDDDRLIAILENIIRNKGTFKPVLKAE